ncbi:hypothetical protein GTG23_30665 [Rhodococcus hoagii]|nr:hypothetical protein [Prescottella equi]
MPGHHRIGLRVRFVLVAADRDPAQTGDDSDPIPGDDPGPEPQPAPPLDVGTIEPGPPTAPIGAPHVRNVELVSQVTGPGSENRTDKRWR